MRDTAASGQASQFSDARLDALKEVANIGAGHAATALSTLAGGRIMISVPTIKFVIPTDEARRACVPSATVVVVKMEISGSMKGRTAFILPSDGARRLAERMLGREAGSVTIIGELEQSAMSEAGNIIGGAYLTALSEFMHMRLLPSPPIFSSGDTAEALGGVFPTGATLDTILCVETEFKMTEPDETLWGFFILIPDATSFEAIFSAVRVS